MNGTKRVLFITEILSRPFDEGMKNVAFSLHKNLKNKTTLLAITRDGNDIDGLDNIKCLELNRLFLSKGLIHTIKDYLPHIILYMPETSITFNSFIRARILRSVSKASRILLFATIRRGYTHIQRFLIQRFLRPDMVFLFGGFRDWVFNGIKTHILPPAIDIERFSIPTREEKLSLRKRYNLPLDKQIVLHVGHVRPTRNVSLLTRLQGFNDIQVLIVDSTSTPQYTGLIKDLKCKGIIILSEYLPDISEIYKLSDLYIFPVRDEIASINLPLSILEAMACGLPVVTTRFGGIEGYFKEDDVFRYLDTDEGLLKLVDEVKMDGRANREKVRDFTWERVVDEMLSILI